MWKLLLVLVGVVAVILLFASDRADAPEVEAGRPPAREAEVSSSGSKQAVRARGEDERPPAVAQEENSSSTLSRLLSSRRREDIKILATLENHVDRDTWRRGQQLVDLATSGASKVELATFITDNFHSLVVKNEFRLWLRTRDNSEPGRPTVTRKLLGSGHGLKRTGQIKPMTNGALLEGGDL